MIYLRTCRLGLSGSECQKYAVVYEKIAGVERPTIVCSGSLRTRIVYLSQSNSVVIETFGGATVDDDDVTGDVKTSRHADDMSRFLLKYQGIIFRYISIRTYILIHATNVFLSVYFNKLNCQTTTNLPNYMT